MLGHSVHDCVEGHRSGGDPNTLIDKFGPWLRAAAVRGGPSRRPRDSSLIKDEQTSSIPPRRRTETSVSEVHVVVGVVGNGGDREVDDTSSSERAGPSPTLQLRGNVGVHVGDARISEKVEHNPKKVPIVEGFATTIVDEITTEWVSDSTQIRFETIPPIIPCENHVDNEVGVDNVVVHVEMDTDNMTRENEGPLLYGLDMVGEPSSKLMWKKRVRE
jgi:hypothetical protein